jgi:hypothetical protein
MNKTVMRKVLQLLCLSVLVIAFQNCSRVAFDPSVEGSLDSKSLSDGRDPGDDTILDDGERDPGDDGVIKDRDSGDDDGDVDEDESEDESEDKEWLYIPGGRGHVPMSSVAVCPAGSKDAGKQKCPMFCFEGKDYVMHKSLAREYFAKKFDEQADYGGGAVPGTCANPDLQIKD